MTAITTQTLESAFASKAHALLCRSYTKGRDWYDFLWYVAKKVRPNLKLLSSAIEQQGPWQGQGIKTTEAWFIDQLRDEISRIDWKPSPCDLLHMHLAAYLFFGACGGRFVRSSAADRAAPRNPETRSPPWLA